MGVICTGLAFKHVHIKLMKKKIWTKIQLVFCKCLWYAFIALILDLPYFKILISSTLLSLTRTRILKSNSNLHSGFDQIALGIWSDGWNAHFIFYIYHEDQLIYQNTINGWIIVVSYLGSNALLALLLFLMYFCRWSLIFIIVVNYWNT